MISGTSNLQINPAECEGLHRIRQNVMAITKNL
jgi:hypothetical protein